MQPLRTSKSDTLYEQLYAYFEIDPDAVDAEDQLAHTLNETTHKHITLARQKHMAEQDLQRLERYLDELIHSVKSVQHSRAWKTGYALMALAKRMTGRKAGGDGFSKIDDIAERYHHWKKSRD